MSTDQDISTLPSLAAVREAIDAIDDQMLVLLNRRARCAERVAELKSHEPSPQFYRPEREAQIHRRLIAQNTGPLSNEAIIKLYKDVISACLSLEMPLKIAYLGSEGTFAYAAARHQFGASVQAVPVASLSAVFREVEQQRCQYGIVPIENASEGTVSHTLDQMHESPLKICGEVIMRVSHHLIGSASSLNEIDTVYAPAHALAQCQLWLSRYLPAASCVSVSAQAEAVRRAQQSPKAAVIASEEAARVYELNMLAANIENASDGDARFLVLGHQDTPPSGCDKTSLLLATDNTPGALYELLQPLAEAGVDLSRIESRPAGNRWGHWFFLDIAGHQSEPRLSSVFLSLQQRAAFFRVLGSYPKSLVFSPAVSPLASESNDES